MNWTEIDQPGVRENMVNEIGLDLRSRQFWIPDCLTPSGIKYYPRLFLKAARVRDVHWLLNKLHREKMFRVDHLFWSRGGGTEKRNRTRKQEKQVEKEFHQYYLRALCKKALEANSHARVMLHWSGKKGLETEPRAEAHQRVSARQLLKYLRQKMMKICRRSPSAKKTEAVVNLELPLPKRWRVVHSLRIHNQDSPA
ncbi:hypothetical protein KIH39_18480 [Telmatocola sphagniphila]|uniref:Uncharacterized protein n=1 Tax=Telmatocola sphagniphila TaxID=1123043 RepID=A0A8E6B2C8_9BACT|nr:hypothetical protein [Telmatocola sphagniphila]QVL30825.1 hypothetical protein KIH39_18480 [Telmatocola sphagniphila]